MNIRGIDEAKLILVGLATIFSFGACSQRSESNTLQVDFIKNYNYLDSLNKNNPFDTTCRSSIKYMEQITGIKATYDGNFLGKTLFTTQDLEAWKKWYDDNHK